MDPTDKVAAVVQVLAPAKLVHTGTARVMQMLMPMAMVMGKARVRMVVVEVVKVVDLAMVMQIHRNSTSEKIEPNI
ncbi:unnamed protein product [Urochloa humidicola]